MRLSPLLSIGLLTLTAVGCVPKPSDFQNDAAASSSSAPVLDEKQTAAAALDALMRKDIAAFAAFMHPTNGVRFTASTHVRTAADAYGTPADQRLFADTVAAAYTSQQSRVWGIEDGSGNPIDLTAEQYFDKYVWDHDYRAAPDVRWNHVQDRGSTIDNAAAVYPGAQIVEYHFPGFEPQYGGMDWSSLRLVLQQDAATKRWHVAGVIHDHWTP